MPYTERGAVDPLMRGETVRVRGVGNSMTPLLLSGETVTVAPLAPADPLKIGDVVLCKVRGNVYLHRVKAVEKERVLIGNNHGRINGWTGRARVYGKWTGERG